MTELWKILPGDWKYEYAVSNMGNIKRLSFVNTLGYVEFDKELSRRYTDKYPQVELRTKDNVRQKKSVAELVLEAFGKGARPAETYRPYFKDGDNTNCKLSNLSWKDTHKKRDIGPNSGQFLSKYRNLLVYSGDKLLRYYDSNSDLATELSEIIGTKRDSIMSRCGSILKHGSSIDYYGLHIIQVDDKTYNKAKEDLQHADYSLDLTEYIKLNNRPNSNKKGVSKYKAKQEEIQQQLHPKPKIASELIIEKPEEKPPEIKTNVTKDEFMLNLMMAMDRRR